jgi:rsbT co-antagonist protein RsbR
MITPAVDFFSTYWSACPDAACVLGPDGHIVATNDAFTRLLGNRVGTAFSDHAAESNRPDVQAKVDTLFAGNASTSFFATCNGTVKNTILLAWRAWRTGQTDAPVLAVATSTEFDRQGGTSVEEFLRAQEIIDTSPTFIVAIDAAGTTVFMNSTMLRAIDYAHEDAVGRNYLQTFVPEREHAMLDGIFQRLSSTDKATLNENHIVTRSGKELLVEWHGRPIFNAEQQLRYFYGVGIDVTTQRETQNELLRSQQRLALHFKQSQFGMIEWDADFRVTDWNPAAERIFGYSREEALGKYGQDLVVPEAVRPYVADIWQQLLDSRGGTNAHNENITKDGRTIVCEWSNTTLVNANGEVIGVASLVNDVTDRKRIEEDLRERERAQAATIEQLSVPIIDLWEGVIALPIVGTIDESRAVRMTEALLEAIVQKGTRFAILDLTGAIATDGSIASHLGNMIRATRLVGSECLVSGLGPALARTLVELDVALSVRTFGTLRAALRHAIRATRT